MKCVFLTLMLCGLLYGCESPDVTVVRPAPQPADLPRDIPRMWETGPLASEPGEQASTREAVAAADRVFNTLELRGKTRSGVIALLGHPKHSSRSRYNFPFYPAPKEALVYRFDTGAGGWQFNVLFDHQGKVREVERHGIE